MSNPTAHLVVRLPDALARRFKQRVAQRQRSKFIEQLLERALSEEGEEDDALYQAALAVEQDEQLNAEMAEWEEAMLTDGLDHETGDKSGR